MKNQALFSSKDKSKKWKCRLLQFLSGALRVNVFNSRAMVVIISANVYVQIIRVYIALTIEFSQWYEIFSRFAFQCICVDGVLQLNDAKWLYEFLLLHVISALLLLQK